MRRDEKPNSIFVPETMKLLINRSNSYQNLDLSHHSVTTFLNDEKTHAAINNKLLKRLAHIKDTLEGVELVKSDIGYKEPIFAGLFISQYAKLRILTLYYNFFTNFCDTDKYEEMETCTDSLYSTGMEKIVKLYLRRKKLEWVLLWCKGCIESFTTNAHRSFFSRTSCP